MSRTVDRELSGGAYRAPISLSNPARRDFVKALSSKMLQGSVGARGLLPNDRYRRNKAAVHARFWIEPPSVWTWQVPNDPPWLPPLQARAFIDYTATIISPSAPPPVPDSICPPIGDQIWDTLSVRQKTLQFFDSSGAMLVPMSEVKEYLFTVYRNPDGSYRISVPFQIRKQCGVDFILPSPGLADSTLLAIVHVHPYESGQYVICPDGEEFIYDNAQYNGLSGGDGDFLSMHVASVIARANISPRAVGVYVIDKDRIWRNPPTDSPSTRFDTNRYEPRRPAACRWY